MGFYICLPCFTSSSLRPTAKADPGYSSPTEAGLTNVGGQDRPTATDQHSFQMGSLDMCNTKVTMEPHQELLNLPLPGRQVRSLARSDLELESWNLGDETSVAHTAVQ
jgi:hypothetical protein